MSSPYPTHLYPGCPCFACDSKTWAPLPGTDIVLSRRMSLCPTCGCKRCPSGTDHRNDCTGSNEPGQPGSSYQSYPRSSDEVEAVLAEARAGMLARAKKRSEGAS